ncbi:TolC family protein [Aureibacter tunicatorum]|uniref:Outer membrane protein TolC n=1 Tax=Aureibacter tunicatorum TaxID=866807 RepID=A0AAE3XQW5_9BACT|nr:TolC family protein [Aureibacter tunicatorum]MDR6240271.1 outer membrane protein TolC [Aureibacter tunicatorum]BDD05848.1 membrane protein [Aureibacter tunicatorum]
MNLNKKISLLLLLSCCIAFQSFGQTADSLVSKYRRQALDYNQEVRSAQYSSEAASEIKASSKADFKPKVSANGFYQWRDNPYQLTVPSLTGMESRTVKGNDQQYGASVQVVQPLYTGGAIKQKYEMLKEDEIISEFNVDRVKNNILLETDQVYWMAVGQQEIAGIFDEYYQAIDQLVKVVEQRVEVGTVSRNDLLMVEVKQNEIEYLRQEAQTNSRISEMALNQQVGVPLEEKPMLDNAIPQIIWTDIAEDWTHIALNQRAEISMADHEVLKSEKGEKLAMAKYNMQVMAQLEGSYGLPGYDLTNQSPDENVVAGVSVKVPIFEWGKRKHDRKAAKLDTEVQKQKLSQVSDKIALEVQSNYFALQQANERVALSYGSLDKAEENLKMMNDRYKEGVASILEVLDAHMYWQQAKINYTEAKLNAKNSESAFKRSTGSLLKEMD